MWHEKDFGHPTKLLLTNSLSAAITETLANTFCSQLGILLFLI